MKVRVKIEDQIFEVEVADLSARPILATIEGETFAIWPEAEAAAAAEPVVSGSAPCPPAPVTRAASPEPAANSGKAVAAPIPGVIISVAVKSGDAVKHGQELCILEAMKMKNIIRATREGVIATVLIKAGDTVQHGQPLVEFTE
jgi:biotin carboxyl carrier protein